MSGEITERQLLDRVFETSPVGIVVLTPGGEITRANQRAEELLQLEKSDIEGRSYAEPEWTFVDAEGVQIPEADHPFVQVRTDGQMINRPFTMARPHAAPVQLLISGVPIQSDTKQTERLVFTFEDITALKEREAELQRQNDRLERFASVVSHDLRNPLNVAQGRLELAARECETDHLDSVDDALTRIETLIEDMLTLTRAGNTVGQTEAVEVSHLVEECWGNVASQEATVHTETERTLRADRSRLQQLFENIFRNAIEHGGEDVTVTVGDRPGGFYIEDDGPGIPEPERDQVLGAGFTTSAAGTGFGLNIVSEIAQAHGWEITISESDEGGARFEFSNVSPEERDR